MPVTGWQVVAEDRKLRFKRKRLLHVGAFWFKSLARFYFSVWHDSFCEFGLKRVPKLPLDICLTMLYTTGNKEKEQKMKSTVEYERKLEVMEEHLDDLVFDLVQTIQSFEDLGMRHLSGLESHLMQAKTQLILARDVMWRDCEE